MYASMEGSLYCNVIIKKNLVLQVIFFVLVRNASIDTMVGIYSCDCNCHLRKHIFNKSISRKQQTTIAGCNLFWCMLTHLHSHIDPI